MDVPATTRPEVVPTRLPGVFRRFSSRLGRHQTDASGALALPRLGTWRWKGDVDEYIIALSVK